MTKEIMKSNFGVSVQKINVMTWIKPEKIENLTKIAETHQRTSLRVGGFCFLKKTHERYQGLNEI